MLDTKNLSFILMNHYKEIGFRIYSNRLMGLGERVGSLLLQPGNYTLMSSLNADYNIDDASGRPQGYGNHPIIVGQYLWNHFIGIYVANTHATEVEIM